MILGVAGYVLEALARVRGHPAGDDAAAIGREIRDLERGITPPRPRDTSHGGAPRTDPR